MSPSPSRESSFRNGDSVTQHGVTNALSSLGGVTAAASIASTLAKSLEQKLERKRQVLDKQLEEEALDWQQRQQPKKNRFNANYKHHHTNADDDNSNDHAKHIK